MSSVSCAGVSQFFGFEHDAAVVSVPLLDISFVDDVALPLMAPPERILSDLRMLIEVAVVTFASHGMELNFGKGKSEALIHWGGSRAARCG